MEITREKDFSFKLKGRGGFAVLSPDGFTIESTTGDNKKSFSGPGEYEVAGISVIAGKTDEGVVYTFEVDALRIGYLGTITKELNENMVTLMGDIDILLFPVTAESVEIIQQFESFYAIPYNYKTDEELEKFLKDSGLMVERKPKFSLKKEEIIEESTTQLVVLDNK